MKRITIFAACLLALCVAASEARAIQIAAPGLWVDVPLVIGGNSGCYGPSPYVPVRGPGYGPPPPPPPPPPGYWGPYGYGPYPGGRGYGGPLPGYYGPRGGYGGYGGYGGRYGPPPPPRHGYGGHYGPPPPPRYGRGW